MIIWGKKLVRRRLGYVADFCVLCREVRLFELFKINLCGHIYYISLVEGVLVEHQRRCAACGVQSVVNPGLYARVSRERLGLRELIAHTFPNIAAHYAERFAIEKALRDPFAKVTAAHREALLREPFRMVAYMAEEQFHGGTVDGETIALFFASLLVTGAIAMGLVALLPRHEIEIWTGAFIVAAIATWVLSVWWSRRYVRTRLVPPLASALRPLKPTREELAAVLKDMKGLGLKIGSRVKTEPLLEGLGKKAQA